MFCSEAGTVSPTNSLPSSKQQQGHSLGSPSEGKFPSTSYFSIVEWLVKWYWSSAVLYIPWGQKHATCSPRFCNVLQRTVSIWIAHKTLLTNRDLNFYYTALSLITWNKEMKPVSILFIHEFLFTAPWRNACNPCFHYTPPSLIHSPHNTQTHLLRA